MKPDYRYIALIVLLTLFAYSVSLKYVWTKFHYTESDRMYALMLKLPALPVFWHMNTNEPNAVMYQYRLEQYRLWTKFKMVGGQHGRGSLANLGDNTAANLHRFLSDMGCTHVFISDNDVYQLPLDDPHFPWYFGRQVSYFNFVVYKIIDHGGDRLVTCPEEVTLKFPFQPQYGPELAE